MDIQTLSTLDNYLYDEKEMFVLIYMCGAIIMEYLECKLPIYPLATRGPYQLLNFGGVLSSSSTLLAAVIAPSQAVIGA